jgi:hypothetical protein
MFMKNLTLTLLFTMFSLSQAANASVATDVYGMLSLKEGAIIFKSLEEASFGIEVQIDENSLENIEVGCGEGIFTLAQSLRKDRSYEVIEVTCETLTNASF